ncbi:hypothetical protein GCM10020219_022250 [Nonomuraea dietziae]
MPPSERVGRSGDVFEGPAAGLLFVVSGEGLPADGVGTAPGVPATSLPGAGFGCDPPAASGRRAAAPWEGSVDPPSGRGDAAPSDR